MYKNYFYLNRFALETSGELKGSRLISAYSQEKNKLVLEFNAGENSAFIEVSVDPGFPFILLKENFNRAKKNSVDFFEDFLPSRLQGIETAQNDRVIKFLFEKFSIYFAVRGKYTNLHLVGNGGEIVSFKSEEPEIESNFSDEMKSTAFINEPNRLNELEKLKDEDPDAIRKRFPIIGKEIIIEAKLRKPGDKYQDKIRSIIGEVLEEDISVLFDKDSGDILLRPVTFGVPPFDGEMQFENINGALNFYAGKKYFIEDFGSKKKIIGKHLSRELEKIATKINRIRGALSGESREEEYNRIGNLLLINLHSIKKGMKAVSVEDIYNTDSSLEIKLDPEKSAKQNADYYFNKSKGERIRREKNKSLLIKAENEFGKFKDIEDKFSRAENAHQLRDIMKELKIKENIQKNRDEDIKDKFKCYIIDGKYSVYVGKDSKNNDLLTTKFAKQNDFWFHARSVPGSHVVLRVENSKEAVPKNILKAAASLAAFHSKAKTAGLAPVSYALKKYVVKKKGMEPGKVALMKEDVLLVHPEIPRNCEYSSDD